MLLAMQAYHECLASKTTEAFPIASDSLRLLMGDWIAHLSESEGMQQRVTKLRATLPEEKTNQPLLEVIYDDQDLFVKPSQWMIGGDDWAYDIGYGDIDRVLANGTDVNMLVLGNEVYSNTDSQASKTVPASATAKFAASGKYASKKDLGMMAMTYENIYVTQIASGANQMQTIKVSEEAGKLPGPSTIAACTPCIIHDLTGGMSQALKEARDAVHLGYRSLYCYNSLLRERGKEPTTLDFEKPDFSLTKGFIYQQVRLTSLESSRPDTVELLSNRATSDIKRRFYNYVRLADREEKIRTKPERQSEPEIIMPENEESQVKKERIINPEAEARKVAYRTERAAKKKQRE